jgi:hypothetical protein
VDGSAVASSTYSCDFTYTVPCGDKSGASIAVDSRTLADGSHTVRVAAADPAANEALSDPRTITVDNHAPASPDALSVDGGSTWHDTNSFSASWLNPPGQTAPVSVAHYQLCAANGSGCYLEHQASGSSIAHLDGISVPSKGEWTLRIWLEDAAGNVDSSRSAVTTLRYGTTPSTQSVTDSTQSTTPSTADDLSVISGPATTTPPPLVSPFTRAVPALRVTSARFAHGRLVIRGRTATGAAGAIVLRLRAGGRLVRVVRRVRGGAFRVTLPMGTSPGKHVRVSFPATNRFRAQSLTTRLR